jgi:hypothetical protein
MDGLLAARGTTTDIMGLNSALHARCVVHNARWVANQNSINTHRIHIGQKTSLLHSNTDGDEKSCIFAMPVPTVEAGTGKF